MASLFDSFRSLFLSPGAGSPGALSLARPGIVPWRPLSSLERVHLSLLAATWGVLFCWSRHHVHIVLADPATYVTVLQHRCGLQMLSTLLWAALELRRHSVRPRNPLLF